MELSVPGIVIEMSRCQWNNEWSSWFDSTAYCYSTQSCMLYHTVCVHVCVCVCVCVCVLKDVQESYQL